MDTYLQAGLEALGDPTRLAIFLKLTKGPLAVNQLARNLPISRPAVSQHLRVLKHVRLVTDRKAGTRRIYRVNPEGIAALRMHFDELWGRALTAFQSAADQTNSKHKEKKDGRGRKRTRGAQDNKG